jgi:hypothetical protein
VIAARLSRHGMAALCVLLAASACSDKRPATAQAARPLCSIDTTVGMEKAARDRVFPPQYWFVLLVQGYQSSGVIERPVRDCRGWPVQQDADGCGNQPTTELTPTTLTARELVVSNLGDARRLVWAITDRLPDGQGQGPVALAEVGVHGIGLRALGTLRTFPENVSLRLEKLGTNTLLVAEGEKCAGTGADCERAVRLLPLVGDRFVSKPIIDDQQACLGSAFFPVRTKGGIGRQTSTNYELEATVTFSADAIVVREQLAVSDGHGAAAQTGGAFVTRVQSERTLTINGGRLVATGPSLLDRWLAQHGGGQRPPARDGSR